MKLSVLKEHIDNIVKESLMEYMPDSFFMQSEKEKHEHHKHDDEDKHEHHKHDDEDKHEHHKHDDEDKHEHHKHDDEDKHKHHKDKKVDSDIEADVMKWLDSAQELHSVLAYDLFPDMTKDAARSYFSKKWRKEEGKSFTEEELNRLYDLKSKYIQKIAESIKRNLRNYIK